MSVEHVDVLIVGAGLSGISAAWHLQTACAGLSYAIVEGREQMGGTWDLFRYPGIRSDSDMYTLGYRFRPWRNAKAIADGPSIKAYIEDTAHEFGIDRAIRYRHRLVRAEWSSADARWLVHLEVGADRTPLRLSCGFLYSCAGYYDYGQGYTPAWPGASDFVGPLVHPQHWPADLDYRGKRVVVIGSGATAVTLVPAMANGDRAAAHVTMLQRSPTYIATLPSVDTVANALRRVLPSKLAYAISRWKNVARSMFYYSIARSRPETFKKALRTDATAQLGADFPFEEHFSPRYQPWDERLCMVPDGDLFVALREQRASIVTDTIERFDATGIVLQSGAHLDADIIVAATGLRMSLLSGVTLVVDGAVVDLAQCMTYKGMMLSDVPNMAAAVGYTNASWTLKCDLIAQHVCRLLNYMGARGYAQVTPRRDPSMTETPVFDFTSGYVQRALAHLPKQGDRAPWKLYQNYVKDLFSLRHGRVDDPALEFRTVPAPSQRPALEFAAHD
ncbi:NAD(P)/FAD-dependent oxidoreductase [Gemmatimonas groenlandica]|uniref:NAD(P)/FAD-dependent oxidoreductase n=1 Tax=Gemmatimonas groenlandica TaxID=2732249 RepID=A0A6M4IX97_9BACT|nr:NAD(P)/FAD-dependent oxidoreductase [Gemmatimonas groenlandica]